jgi:hypothetical protein
MTIFCCCCSKCQQRKTTYLLKVQTKNISDSGHSGDQKFVAVYDRWLFRTDYFDRQRAI